MADHDIIGAHQNSDTTSKDWFPRMIKDWGHGSSSEQRPNPTRVGSWRSFTLEYLPSLGLSRFLPVLGLTITTGISALTFHFINQPTYQSDGLYMSIDSNRVAFQVVVHILSNGFGALQIYAVTSFNFWTRRRLTKYATTLDGLKLWRAISLCKIDLGLPLEYLVPAVVFSGLASIPATLWTGSLTPVLSLHQVPLEVGVPNYAPDPNGTF